MDIKVVRLDDELTHLALSGRLYMVGKPELQTKFQEYTGDRLKPALVDISQVSFIAGLGVRMLFKNAKSLAMNGLKMVLLNPQPQVEQILHQAGMTDLLPIAHHYEEAMDMFFSGSNENVAGKAREESSGNKEGVE
jgi:anti-sigma B factor antagonist